MLDVVYVRNVGLRSNKMRPITFAATTLKAFLQRRRAATMAELKSALGTSVDMTIFRKLRELDALSSYSDRGRLYTLRSVAEFDQRGLWSHRGAHFSRFGSLVETAA